MPLLVTRWDGQRDEAFALDDAASARHRPRSANDGHDTFLQMRAREKHAEIIKWGCRFIGIHDAMMSTLATKVGSNI
nr:hypothetical protein [uncultured Pseudoxanthomonas sp.]